MSATLREATMRADREAAVLLRFSDEPCERPRLPLSEIYTGAEGDEPHAACVAADGSIVRWRADTTDHYIYRQVITDPSVASQWSSWTKSAERVQALTEEVYLDVWCDPVTGMLYSCWIDGALGTSAHWAYSTDDGATWSAAQQVKDWGTGKYVGGIAGVAHGGTSYLLVAVNPLNAYDDSYVELFIGAGTSLPTSAATTPADRDEIRGIGCARDASGKLTAWVADWSPSRISYLEYVPGTGWGDSGVFKQAGVGSGLTYSDPRVSVVEVAPGVHRFVTTHAEHSPAPAYDRAVVGIGPVGTWLLEEVPWRFAAAHGLEILKTDAWWYFVQSDRAYRVSAFDPAAVGARLDLDEWRVASLETRERAGEPGRLRVALDNSDGSLDAAGVSGAAKCVRPGAQLGLALGLRTSAGRELVWRQSWWVERVEHRRDGKRRLCIVEARDAIGELASLRARRLEQQADTKLGTLLQRAWWRVSGEVIEEVDYGAALSLVVPFFQVAAGEPWDEVVGRISRMTGKLVRFYNGSATGVGWTAARAEVLDYGSGDSVWTFGGAGGQPFVLARHWSAAPAYQGTRVQGAGYLGEWRDWSAVWESWRDTARGLADGKLDAQAEVDDRAAYEHRFLAGEGCGGVIECGLVAGLEVGDVVTVTDELASLTAQPRYVRGLRLLVDPQRNRHECELELEQAISC